MAAESVAVAGLPEWLVARGGRQPPAEAVLIAGIDEVGRGCLAGPVYVAAVILAPQTPIAGLRDSKKLSAARREALDGVIREAAQAWAIARASVEEIERFNILGATFLAMQRAAGALQPAPQTCLIDGNGAPQLPCPTRTIIGGDAVEPSIMAASIIAKVARDAHMQALDAAHPGYGFAKHKGYGTPEHLAALNRLGPCAMHRMGFAPCSQAALPLDGELGPPEAGR